LPDEIRQINFNNIPPKNSPITKNTAPLNLVTQDIFDLLANNKENSEPPKFSQSTQSKEKPAFKFGKKKPSQPVAGDQETQSSQ
jgi:hypothetical protein